MIVANNSKCPKSSDDTDYLMQGDFRVKTYNSFFLHAAIILQCWSERDDPPKLLGGSAAIAQSFGQETIAEHDDDNYECDE